MYSWIWILHAISYPECLLCNAESYAKHCIFGSSVQSSLLFNSFITCDIVFFTFLLLLFTFLIYIFYLAPSVGSSFSSYFLFILLSYIYIFFTKLYLFLFFIYFRTWTQATTTPPPPRRPPSPTASSSSSPSCPPAAPSAH